MRTIRNEVFETNSSSTHSLVMGRGEQNYLPPGKQLLVRWIDTSDEYYISTLQDKVSYLISHIANQHKYSVTDYEDLLDNIKRDSGYLRISDYVMTKYSLEIKFPKSYKGDIEDIVSINHQLVEYNLEDVLDDIVRYNVSNLDIVLSPDNAIEIGFD